MASLPAGEGSGCRVALCRAAEAGCAAAGRHGREAEKEGTTLPVPGQLSLRRFLSLFTVWCSKAASEGSGFPRRCLRYWWIWGLPYSCLTLLMEEKSCLESWWSSEQPEPVALSQLSLVQAEKLWMPLSVLPRSLIAPKQSLERYKKKRIWVYVVPHQPQFPDTLFLSKRSPLRGLCSQAWLGFSLSAVVQDDLLFPGASPRWVPEGRTCTSLCITLFELHPLLQLSLPSLAAVKLLALPPSQSSPPRSLSRRLLSHVALLRHTGCLSPYFIDSRFRQEFLQGFPASQRGWGKRRSWKKCPDLLQKAEALFIPASRAGQLVRLVQWVLHVSLRHQPADGQGQKTKENLLVPAGYNCPWWYSSLLPTDLLLVFWY